MILVGPTVMFGGLLVCAWINDRRLSARLGSPEEQDAADARALEEQAHEEQAREDREREQGSDFPWALERLGHLLAGRPPR